MTAFFIANVKIKDSDKFQEYARKAGATFANHGGEPVLKGKVEATLAGRTDHHAVGIVRFPSAEALTAWHDSPAYQALIPLREEAAEMSITTYSIPT